MISPTTDLMCVGLGSIIVLAPLVLFGHEGILGIVPNFTAALAMTIVLNMAHFMASYRILYRTKANILRHKWAAIIVPSGLIAYLLYALQQIESNPTLFDIVKFGPAIYLAWHYTGQVWGMMATYGHLSGQPFSGRERLLIRLALRIQLAWHVTWFLQAVGIAHFKMSLLASQIYFIMSCATFLAFALVLTGFFLYRRRTGKLPPLRACVAWLALCFWYAALAQSFEMLVWVQTAHAVQYLSFPARVEINHHRKTHPDEAGGAIRHVLLYFAALVAIAFTIEWSVNYIGVPMVADLFGHMSGAEVPVAFFAFLNVHHFFTDGCIWKISNKEVKQELFAHLKK